MKSGMLLNGLAALEHATVGLLTLFKLKMALKKTNYLKGFYDSYFILKVFKYLVWKSEGLMDGIVQHVTKNRKNCF